MCERDLVAVTLDTTQNPSLSLIYIINITHAYPMKFMNKKESRLHNSCVCTHERRDKFIEIEMTQGWRQQHQ